MIPFIKRIDDFANRIALKSISVDERGKLFLIRSKTLQRAVTILNHNNQLAEKGFDSF